MNQTSNSLVHFACALLTDTHGFLGSYGPSGELNAHSTSDSAPAESFRGHHGRTRPPDSSAAAPWSWSAIGKPAEPPLLPMPSPPLYQSAWPQSMPTLSIPTPPSSTPLPAYDYSQHFSRQVAATYAYGYLQEMYPCAPADPSSAGLNLSRHEILSSRVATAKTRDPLPGAGKALGVSKNTLKTASRKPRVKCRQEREDELQKQVDLVERENQKLQKIGKALSHDIRRLKCKSRNLTREKLLERANLSVTLSRNLAAAVDCIGTAPLLKDEVNEIRKCLSGCASEVVTIVVGARGAEELRQT